MNPTAQLPTDAIRVTREQLADILHQSYIHGSEHGWKTHFKLANDRLQASYEQDMQATAATFAKHEKVIREEAFDRGYEYGMDDCEAQLTSL
jgi:ribulose bisphosphate carboxylase small subunit